MRLLPTLGLRRRAPAKPAPAGPLRLAFDDPAGDARRRVLVTLLGVPEADAERLIDMALKSVGRDAVPIFVTSSLDFAPFRSRRALFEYLPPPARLGFDDTTAAEDYVREKLELIRAKWCAAAETTLGQSPEDFLHAPAAGVSA